MNELNNTGSSSGFPSADGGQLLLYNITTQVAWHVHEVWLAWMLDEHIPSILGTGCFIRHQVVRLLETDETDGPVYAVQYYIESKAQYNTFIDVYQAAFKNLEQQQWGDRIFSFTSLMQVVN